MILRKTILIFPAGSEVGLEIYEALRHNVFFKTIGASSVWDHANFIYPNLVSLPFYESGDFIIRLNEIVKNHQIDALYPCMDGVSYFLSKNRDEINCDVIGSPFLTQKITYSKTATYQLLKEDIRVPITYEMNSFDYSKPLFIKPDKGYGSRRASPVRSSIEENYLCNLIEGPVLMENLPGQEFSVDCFTDRFQKLRYCKARIRARIKMGISVSTMFAEEQEEANRIAHIINQKLTLKGAWFFQLKKNEKGELVLLEIGTRIAGSSSINRISGVNLPLLTLFDHFGTDIEIDQNKLFPIVDRALNVKAKFSLNFIHLYFDFDDCLVINNKVNESAIALIYKVINMRKKVFLLTKHEGDLEKVLKNFRLGNLFDEIIHLQKDQNKSDYILPNSLFIDDSYAERRLIDKSKNIIALGPDTIDMIISSLN